MKSASEWADKLRTECTRIEHGSLRVDNDAVCRMFVECQSDAIRAAAEKCEDAGTIFCSVDMSTATIRVKNFKNIKSEILSLIQD